MSNNCRTVPGLSRIGLKSISKGRLKKPPSSPQLFDPKPGAEHWVWSTTSENRRRGGRTITAGRAATMRKLTSRPNQENSITPRRGQDWRPRFRELFNERLVRGQSFYTPCLGWKEFAPSYFGPFRESTKRE